jgi:hypothetical protein
LNHSLLVTSFEGVVPGKHRGSAILGEIFARKRMIVSSALDCLPAYLFRTERTKMEANFGLFKILFLIFCSLIYNTKGQGKSGNDYIIEWI